MGARNWSFAGGGGKDEEVVVVDARQMGAKYRLRLPQLFQRPLNISQARATCERYLCILTHLLQPLWSRVRDLSEARVHGGRGAELTCSRQGALRSPNPNLLTIK